MPGRPVQPAAGAGAASGNGAWPAIAGRMVELQAEAGDERRVVEQRVAGWPMKLVATPRPEKNDWKSIVGPWIVALRPPAHSTWATFRPPRSAAWAMRLGLQDARVEGRRACCRRTAGR